MIVAEFVERSGLRFDPATKTISREGGEPFVIDWEPNATDPTEADYLSEALEMMRDADHVSDHYYQDPHSYRRDFPEVTDEEAEQLMTSYTETAAAARALLGDELMTLLAEEVDFHA